MVKPEKFDYLHLVYHFTVPLSDHRRHRFKHNFQCAYNLFRNCLEDIETSCHYLLHIARSTQTKNSPPKLNLSGLYSNGLLKITFRLLKFSFTHLLSILDFCTP